MFFIFGFIKERYKIGHSPRSSNITGESTHRHLLAEKQDPKFKTSICNGMQPLYRSRHMVSDMYLLVDSVTSFLPMKQNRPQKLSEVLISRSSVVLHMYI